MCGGLARRTARRLAMLKKDCAQILYYFCFFCASFACIGTFASFLFSRNTSKYDSGGHKYLKITCPLLLVGSFIVMGVVRCCTKSGRNHTSERQEMTRANIRSSSRMAHWQTGMIASHLQRFFKGRPALLSTITRLWHENFYSPKLIKFHLIAEHSPLPSA